MNRKTWISLVLALLMIVSTYTALGTAGITQKNMCQPGTIDFTKSVWNNGNWEDTISDVLVGTNVRFNISLTYHKDPGNPNPWTLHEIVITDKLPECLVFAGNVTFFNAPEVETQQNENILTWNFSGIEYCLPDGATMTIEFDATVIGSEQTENENNATVEASECYHYYHSAEDSAWVYVYVPPSIDVQKEVYDPATGQWVDYLDHVQKGVPVRFRISVTYLGIDDIELMKCMIVDDYLPGCCLEYTGNETFSYPSDLFENPDITVSDDNTYVKYDWSNKLFNLYVGQTISIEFDANVVNYCYYEVQNWAYVNLWSCYECQDPVHIYGQDYTTINCVPPPTQFEKKVQDPVTGDWVEDTFQYVNQTVNYMIELTYYGNYNLTDVSIVDYLPFITYYNNEASIEPTSVSEDGKTIWWNLTEPVQDGVPLVIVFNAYVWGSTGDCDCCGINLAQYTAVESETQASFQGEDTANITTDYMADPVLAYSPNNIDFGTHDQGWTGSDTFSIWNSGAQTLTYSISYDMDWIQVNPESGSSTGEHNLITVSVINTDGLSGFYSGNINIISNGGSGTVFVALYINPPVHEPEKKLNITIPKKAYIGKVCASIENTGESDISSITWQINLTAGIRKKVYSAEGTIDLLEINKMQQVCTGKTFGKSAIKLRFGKITGVVTATAGETSASITFSGFVIGRMIIIRSYTTPQ